MRHGLDTFFNGVILKLTIYPIRIRLLAGVFRVLRAASQGKGGLFFATKKKKRFPWVNR